MQCLTLPFFQEIENSQTVLLAGAGGGFDIFSGLPLYFGLRALGKRVYLANLSFSPLHMANGRRLSPALMEVTADTQISSGYFPEGYLARWFVTQGEEVPIYCFERTGVQPLLVAYQTLVEHLGIDAVILVDGGTDSLMRGDEPGLGTPEEDIASIAAVHQLQLPIKLLVCLGFGVDTFHGVCHAHFLEAVADLTRHDGFLGTWSLTESMPEVQRYREATEAVLREMSFHPSIVSTSILSALAGLFGDVQMNARTAGSKLFINVLMTLYWCFRLDPVARRLLYLDQVLHTQTSREMRYAIEFFRTNLPKKKEWIGLPM